MGLSLCDSPFIIILIPLLYPGADSILSYAHDDIMSTYEDRLGRGHVNVF